MPSLETSHIVRQLFEKYYAKPEAATDQYASSHWRELHEDARVQIEGGKVVKLSGTGFGDLQNASLVYRSFSWLTVFSYLMILKNRVRIMQLLPAAIRLSRKMGLYFTYDAFRQVCVFAALEPYLQNDTRILNIGDGYGFFSVLLKDRCPGAKITCVDLGKTLLFQAYHCQKVFPESRCVLVTEQGQAPSDRDFTFCPAENLESLAGEKFDLAVNIASMQEMNFETVARYFRFLRGALIPGAYFYCCNREEKVMPGGEVSRFADYPWDAGDQHVIDEICPWYRYFFSFHRTKRGPAIGRWRVPFINYFDGETRHRLTKLKTSEDKT